MNYKKSSGSLGLLALAAVTVSPLAAADHPGWYLGGNAGGSFSKIDDPRIVSGLLANGFTTTSIEDDDRDFGYKLFAGYRIAPYFAIEGGYFDLGKFGFTATTNPPGTLTGQIELRGVNLDLVAILPMTDRFSVFGRVGANYAEAKDTFTGTGAVIVPNPEREQRGTNYKAGAGLEFDLTPALSLRLEGERYRIDDGVGNKGDVDLASLGLLLHFGSHSKSGDGLLADEAIISPPPPVAYTPPPPPPPPPPVAARPPPPAPVMPTKLTFSADALFDFNQSTVKPDGRKELDAFAEQLRFARYEVIRVTGHTDRVGSSDYNARLSQRRADAVKDYLVGTGIPAAKISAQGMSESQPVTREQDCRDNQARRASPQLIACLQPDRRVEVEVTGTAK